MARSAARRYHIPRFVPPAGIVQTAFIDTSCRGRTAEVAPCRRPTRGNSAERKLQRPPIVGVNGPPLRRQLTLLPNPLSPRSAACCVQSRTLIKTGSHCAIAPTAVALRLHAAHCAQNEYRLTRSPGAHVHVLHRRRRGEIDERRSFCPENIASSYGRPIRRQLTSASDSSHGIEQTHASMLLSSAHRKT